MDSSNSSRDEYLPLAQRLIESLRQDEEGRALLERLRSSPPNDKIIDRDLRARLQAKFSTEVSGGEIDNVVNIAKAEIVKIIASPPPISERERPDLGSGTSKVGTFFGADAPSLPQFYIRRKEKFKKLREYVLADETGDFRQQLVVLHGIGGIGKSRLALDLVRDQETLEYFKDGVFWLKIGQDANEATLIERMQNISSKFSQQEVEQKYSNINDACSQLNKTLQDKLCIIVLDDVWNSMHISPFLNSLGTRCRLLVTTRKKEISEEFGGREVVLKLLSLEKASEILQKCAGRYESTFPEILEKLNGLTLAVVLVGKQLKITKGEDWLREFNQVSLIKYGRNPKNADESLKISIDLSLNHIFTNEQNEKKLYYSLGAFPKDTFIPINTIIKLCKRNKNSLTSPDCRDIIAALDDQELLEIDDKKQSVTINGLLHDYNLENLGNSYLETQNSLLYIYNPDKADWYTIQNDGYIYMYLAYHLKEAGRPDELRSLLFNFRWLQAKLNETDITALVADYDIAMTEDEKNNRQSELNLVKNALQLSAHILVKQKNQLWEQLYGRLNFLPGQLPNIQRMLESSVNKFWLRPLEECLFTPATPLLQTLQGHHSTISSIAMNDKFIISASDDRTLRVWSSDGNLMHILSGHQYGVTSVAISADGKHAISASYDCTWKKWDLERDGKVKEFKTFPSSQGSVFSVALSSDNTKVVSGGQDGTLKVWDFATGHEIKTLSGHEGAIATVAISKDGNTVVSGSYDRTIKIWDLATGKETKKLTDHEYAVLSIALYESEDKKIIVSGSADLTLKVWDFEQVQNGETDQPIQTLNQGIYGWISSIFVSHDGNFVIFGSYDSTLRLWDFKAEQPTRLFHGHGRQITAVALSPDSSIAISGSHDNTLKVWDLNIEQKQPENLYSPRKILSVKTIEDNNTIFCGSNDGLLQIYNAESRELIRELDRQDLIARSVDVNRDGTLGVAGLSDGSVRVWNLETRKLKHRLMGHNGRVMTVALSSNCEIIVSGSEDATIRVWDLETGLERFPPLQTNAHVHSAILSSDSKILYAGLSDSTIKAWNLELRQELYTIRKHEAPVHTITLSPDEKTLWSGSADKTIKAWNSETGDLLFQFPEHHQDWLWSVKVSQDGKLLMSASEDCTVRIWNIKNQQNIATFHLENIVFDCVFAANNTIVVCCASSSKPLFFKLENYSYDD